MDEHEIHIIYIDDNPDLSLNKFLRTFTCNNVCINYKSVVFDKNTNYRELIKKEKLQDANILIIDSKLFEDAKVKDQKFSGEQLSAMLRMANPFLEVLVISQNEVSPLYDIFAKYRSTPNITDLEYYTNNLGGILQRMITKIISWRTICNDIEKEHSIDANTFDKVMIEKLSNSLDGIDEYRDLNTNDIDNLITCFEKLKIEVEKNVD